MYSVQGYACCTLTLQSCNSVYFRVQTLYIPGVAQCCIGANYAIVPYHRALYCSVVVHTSLYLLIMHLTILRISTFQFGTLYIQICTALIAVQIWIYQVPN